MGIFERIHVQGFRRLQDVDIPLRPLNVLIGANSSGKTSLLDVFSLLAASASGGLQNALNNMGGIESNLTNLVPSSGGVERLIRFALAGQASGGTLKSDTSDSVQYELELYPRGFGYDISKETLTENMPSGGVWTHIESRGGDVRFYDHTNPTAEEKGLTSATQLGSYNFLETTLSQAPLWKGAVEFRRRLASLTHYHVLDVSKRAPVRLPQPLRDAKLPGREGEDLVSCLYTLRETDPDCFESIEETLRAAFLSFERLGFPPVAAGTLAMTWKESTSKQPFYMHQLSEGTLRFLWLVTLLQSPGLTAVTMIDEPEVSLHPELLSLLAEVMREASQRTQLIVATHADRLVRFLQPSEVLTIDINEEGAAQFKWADELDLQQWLDEYTLDEVWRMGRMGARP